MNPTTSYTETARALDEIAFQASLFALLSAVGELERPATGLRDLGAVPVERAAN